MLTKKIKLLSVLLLVCLSGTALAQSNSQNNQAAAPQAAKNEPEYVDITGFKGKIIEVKNRSPQDLARIVAPLGSGFKGAKLIPNSQPSSITIRDFPENIATVEEALKRLDTPLPPKSPEPEPPARPDVEVYGYVLMASQGEDGNSNFPKAIEDVVKQLQINFNYKSYRLLTSIVQRARLEGRVASNGIVSLADGSISGNYDFNIGRIGSELRSGENSSLVLSNIDLKFNGHALPNGQPIGNARIATDVRIREGEKIVIGTASLRDKTLILVLTTKVLK
ncbi:MAG: secretin N-terminal domain-containing protein [Blastocatellia bacterium]